ncbi:hypothetical protein [Streptomyces sp. CAU 1734]|uniref:hypothetical protein n=1 Tax=Streptomyces sp. CAU 1734 TaxID=3140360 RepID=UPI0032618AB6
MTSTADTTQHPDVSEISDLTEGLLPPSQSADLRQHLEQCELCADVQASLEEIRGLLGTLPGTPRMPADIAERIDAALAAEALLDATAPVEQADVSRETSPTVPRQGPGREPGHPAGADRPAGRSRGTTGPGRTRSARRRSAVITGIIGVAAAGLGVVFFQGLPGFGGDGGATKSLDVSAEAQSSVPQYDAPDLKHRVKELLADTASPRAAELEKKRVLGGDSATPQLKSATDVPPCVQRATGRTDAPLASEDGQYEGEHSYLVVLPHSSDRHRVQAYVVAAECASAAPSSTGKLLLSRSYARP